MGLRNVIGIFNITILAALTVSLARAAEPVIPPLNSSPGPEYSDDVRMFQGIPTIERAPNGRRWRRGGCAWSWGGVYLGQFFPLDPAWWRLMLLER